MSEKQEDNIVLLSQDTTNAQFADQIVSILEGSTFGTVISIEIIQTEREQSLSAHMVQYGLKRRVVLSRRVVKHGQPFQSFSTFSLFGKDRGNIRWESSDSHKTLIIQGLDSDKGFLQK